MALVVRKAFVFFTAVSPIMPDVGSLGFTHALSFIPLAPWKRYCNEMAYLLPDVMESAGLRNQESLSSYSYELLLNKYEYPEGLLPAEVTFHGLPS